jgi:hypothetical protein
LELRWNVGLELALEHGDLVFQEELAFLEALQLDLVLGGALRQAGDYVIEVPVFRLQLIDSDLEGLDFGGMYHGQIPPYQRRADSV